LVALTGNEREEAVEDNEDCCGCGNAGEIAREEEKAAASGPENGE
jgi:hypothetical protein